MKQFKLQSEMNNLNWQKQILRLLALVALACATALPVWAQRPNATTRRFDTPVTGTGATARGSEVIMLSDEDYRLAPKDVIEVIVEDAEEFSRNYTISSAGTILISYIGPVKATGLTAEELAKQIADGLRGRYLKNPQVNVAVKQYNSRSFFIQGAVRSPGLYLIEGRPTLLRLISIAGGLQDSHGPTAFVIREKTGPVAQAKPATPVANNNGNASGLKAETGSNEADNQIELLTAQINGLFRGQLDQNLLIEPGDVVTIPQMDVFYVAGEVSSPGAYPLKEGTTLRQAIALAQGTLFKAATNRAVIFRDDQASGARKEIPIDINAVMSGKSKEDIPIMPNDIIMIPNSRVKSISQALLQALGTNSARLPMPR